MTTQIIEHELQQALLALGELKTVEKTAAPEVIGRLRIDIEGLIDIKKRDLLQMISLKTVPHLDRFNASDLIYWDIDFVKKYYRNDYEHALDMHITFLSETIPQLTHLQEDLKSEKWEDFIKRIYRIKPTFIMVGLANISDKLTYIESVACFAPNIATLQPLLDITIRDCNRAEALIRDKLHLLKELMD